MFDHMNRLKLQIARHLTPQDTPADTRSRRARSLGLIVEGLEDRVVMSAVSWVGSPTGGSWDTGTNWSTGLVPTINDDVTIALSGKSSITVAGTADAAKSLNSSGQTTLDFTGAHFEIGTGGASFAGNVTIESASTVAVDPKAISLGFNNPPITVNGTTTYPAGVITVNGSLTVGATVPVTFTSSVLADTGTVKFATGDTVTLIWGATTIPKSEIDVNPYGLLNATGTTFNQTGTTVGTSIVVFVNGHLTGMGNTFATSNVSINDGAILYANDLTGNDFTGTVLTTPVIDVPLLTKNLQFAEVDLLPGTLGAGQNISLTSMGTKSTAALNYVFIGNYTVAAGATLTVGPNVNLTLSNSVLADLGTLNFATGDAISLVINPSTAPKSEIDVYANALMTATGTNFNQNGSKSGTAIVIGANGHFTGSGNNFSVSSVYFNNGVILNAGDLTGNEFSQSVVTLPLTDVPLMTNNLQFTEVDLLPGTLASGGNIPLTAMGTATAGNLFYVFTGNYTVSTNAVLTLASGVHLTLNGALLTDNGTLNFGLRTTTTLLSGATGSPQSEIYVSPTGLMTAPGSSFNQTGTTNGTSIVVDGQIKANGAVFSLSQLILDATAQGSIINSTITAAPAVTFNVQAGEAVTITDNNFAGIGQNGIVATGNPSATILMASNAWGTSAVAAIHAKIVDQFSAPTQPQTRPLVIFNPFFIQLTAIVASPVTATYSVATQTVPLQASFTNAVTGGTVTFTIFDSLGNAIATSSAIPVTSTMVMGTVTLPAKTPVGTYTIDAEYSGSSTDSSASDVSQLLKVTPTSATLVPPTTVTATYNGATSQSVTLTSNVTSGSTPVPQGVVTYNVTLGTTVITTTATVVNGVATGTFTLPAGTAGGTYSIQASYKDPAADYVVAAASKFNLVVNPAPVTVSVPNTSTTFSIGSQSVPVQVTVSSNGAGTVSAGTVTFTLTGTLGATVTGTASIVGGVGSTILTLPAGLAAGTYTLDASYAGTANFATASETAATLTIGKAVLQVTVPSVQASYNPSVGLISLTANVANGTTPVNEGTVTFQVFNGSTLIGMASTGTVVAGVATASYSLSAGLGVGNLYSIVATFNTSANYLTSTPATGALKIIQAVPVFANLSTSQTISYGQAAVVTVTGKLAAGASVPAGASVAVTLGSGTGAIAGTAVVGANGTFTLSIPITSLPLGTYTIKYSFAGTTNFAAATDASTTLKLNQAVPLFGSVSASQTINYGDSTGVTVTGKLAAGTVVPVGASVVLVIQSATGAVSSTAVVEADGTFKQTLGIGPLAAGAYTIKYGYLGSTDFAKAYDASTSLTIKQLVPVFTNLTASETVTSSQAGVTVSGRLGIGNFVPAGTGVVIAIQSSLGAAYSTALIKADGTFSQILGTQSLTPGAYTITYTFLGSANFAPVSNATTTLAINGVPVFSNLTASQTISYGTTTAVTVAGRLAAGVAAPIGSSVVLVIQSAAGAVSSSAVVGVNGLFSQTINVATLAPGVYKIKYGFLGAAGYTTAYDDSTSLTINS